MPILWIEHVTTYRYRRPVSFGTHRLLGRPRDSADQCLLDWSVEVSPEPYTLQHMRDAADNLTTLITIPSRASELRIVNRLTVDHTSVTPHAEALPKHAATWPCQYDPGDATDLAKLREPSFLDPEHAVAVWARRFLHTAETPTLTLLSEITHAIRDDFSYIARFEEGIQSPARTLSVRSGTCRDFAVLMIEAVRFLGFAARFVTGYLYCPKGENLHGGGATHAWVEVYIPGIGWVDFDPTNGIVGSRDLVRIAAVRDWQQAVPLAGTWNGLSSDFIDLEVSVSVREVERSIRENV
ncbi:transglutaminase family protein [Kozakia baliensis]|uniref:Uncharacterized protein n=1 Tax=Kozakia baliensis TaxID=153496 RepID=A0A1D8UYX4_9PROT|nr:transglutaminase family protein [Kozakia baliensis]AOX18819.1 hypothetical protein A0U89_16125 [Kozakia baliensis]GBR33474.1 putative cysteine protease [Kozakia baliensis NRIC 0488]GEL65377.1 transglutaminase [Kozakia baliensis]